MVQVIPAIIAKDFEELKEKIKKVEPYVDWVQFDAIDGKFADNSVWNNPADLKELKTKLKLEAHLLIKNPELVIDDWISSGVARIIFHYSSTEKHQEIINKVKGAGLRVGLALNPEISIEVVDFFIKQLDSVMVMTVNPGWSGQEFLPENLDKVRQLREKYQEIDIEVDGGVNLGTAPKVVEAGANILAVGSAIFKSNNIKETIWKLKN
ncbi:MAG: ribulose-phosphate 3-epimerase [Parcubacteria group bacterium]|jgi:ribulose-phosphate 3-epimerase|nr:ribulose-phosphate 3-epimerase [Parcubacteria group bacterium]|tara:strand:+ start:11712 stop:12338 length:627 start_codon:yes stop_codon:yes gene_type:complete